jgi:deazaflavin-dependent oxidoreductase (nitroreductase family)
VDRVVPGVVSKLIPTSLPTPVPNLSPVWFNRAVNLETLRQAADESFCYVTTTGRRTGRPHTIEIWFGAGGTALYLLSGGGEGSDWVRNIRADPRVHVRVGKLEMDGTARVVTDSGEDAMARRLLAAKYQGWREGGRLSSWARTALPIAIDIDVD